MADPSQVTQVTVAKILRQRGDILHKSEKLHHDPDTGVAQHWDCFSDASSFIFYPDAEHEASPGVSFSPAAAESVSKSAETGHAASDTADAGASHTHTSMSKK